MSVTFTSSAGAVVLSNPILGDSQQQDLYTQFHITMSKNVHSTMIVPNDDSGSLPAGKEEMLLLTFVNITDVKYNEFITWLVASRGLDITYTDYDADDWIGDIMNNPFEITPNGKRVCAGSDATVEVATFTIEFAGAKQ